MNLVDELLEIVARLEQAEVEYAICGGIAVTLHGAVRTTKDLVILIRPNERERVVELVRPLGYAFAAVPMVFDAGTPQERHLQRVTKVDAGIHLVLDLSSAVGVLEFALDDPKSSSFAAETFVRSPLRLCAG